MKLRSMNAEVRNITNVMVMDCYGEVHELGLCRELTSYDSVVAYYCVKTGIVYLLPRYGYSVTTWKHIHAFVQDYCDGTPDWCAKRIRQDMGFYAKTPNYGATYVPCVCACTYGGDWFRW